MPRRTIIVALLALVALLVAAPAQASRSQTLTFEAPRELLSSSASMRASGFSDLEALGAKRLRIVLYWKDVAPGRDSSSKPSFDATDPKGYDWSKYDPAIAGAKERGWPVLLTVTGPVPYWATLARRDDRTRPSPTEFERFMEAVAKHYGDDVSQFAIWNEPNLPRFLLPQYFKGEIASPQIYRKLVVAGIKGLKAGGLSNPSVLLGETAPRGNASTVSPLAFLRGTLCLNKSYKRDASCAKLDVDGYAHHAYTTKQGPFFVPDPKTDADDVTIGVLGRLVKALDRAGAAGAIPRKLPIYLTEFGIQSTPDPVVGVSQQRQAEYQALSERLAWSQPRVRSFSQYLLRDDLPSEGEEKYGGFESGLRFSGGGKKLSFAAFPVPLSALRSGSTVSLWGLARLAGERTKVTVLAGRSSFTTYKSYTTDSRGYFSGKVPYVAGRSYRLRWTSDDGTVHTGPPIRVITGR